MGFSYLSLYGATKVQGTARSPLYTPIPHRPESHELTRIINYLDSWLNRTQFVMVLTDSHSP